MNKALFITVVIIVLIGIFLVLDGGWRHDDQTATTKAWHVCLPGYETNYHFGEDIDCSKYLKLDKLPPGNWLGSGKSVDGSFVIEINDKTIPTDEQEKMVGEFFIKSGWAQKGSELKMIDGHWHVYQAPSQSKYFTWQAFYRVSPWCPVQER